MTCPQEPVPAGWKVWRGAVPAELTQVAMDVRDHVRQYPRGAIVQTVDYQGQTVGVFVSSHTWTYKRQPNGTVKLLTGICIPGVSLLTQTTSTTGHAASPAADDLSTPDPNAAVFGADDVPETGGIDWAVVEATAAVAIVLVAGFLLALRHAGRALPR